MRTLNGILFVAATCIGSGMIALPITLAKIGLIPSIIVMMLVWLVIYHTSLVNVELNLQAGKGMGLGELGSFFSGKQAKVFGDFLIQILSYALLSAYIASSSSIVQKVSSAIDSFDIALLLLVVLNLPVNTVKLFNNGLFILMMMIVAILIGGLFLKVDLTNMPLFADVKLSSLKLWDDVVPVVFTCFGFQVIFHTLTEYCNREASTLKKVFLWGSFIPALVYIVWTVSVLGSLYNKIPNFYFTLVTTTVSPGDLVQNLSMLASDHRTEILIQWTSFLAVITSAIGVGLGLCQSIKQRIVFGGRVTKAASASLITITPAYLVSVLIPGAFISVLGFAGIILSFIAILLPIYLLRSKKIGKLNYEILNNKYMLFLSFVFGVFIVINGVAKIISSVL